jgi:hypothetical protein|tara:strand:- start:468 stop:638 length:171 start_codon:yes stop_codon:yes gene_type:complete
MSIVISSSLDSIISASISSGGPSNFIYTSSAVTLTDKAQKTITLTDRAIDPIIIQD